MAEQYASPECVAPPYVGHWPPGEILGVGPEKGTPAPRPQTRDKYQTILTRKVLQAKKHKKSDAFFSNLSRKVQPTALLARLHDPSEAPSTVDGHASLRLSLIHI